MARDVNPIEISINSGTEVAMRRSLFMVGLIVLWAASANTAFAFGIEVAGGGWSASPNGYLAYDTILPNDKLDLEQDLDYGTELSPFARIKIDMPMLLPNIYVMGTVLKYEETTSLPMNFNFGDDTFSGNVSFKSKLKLNHLDVALFYGIPMLETATAGILNVDVGLNLRIVDFEAEIDQPDTGLKEKQSYIVPIPTVYLGAQVKPLDWLAVEGEARGIVFSDNWHYSVIGRLKIKPIGPLFVAGGYRYDKIKFDEQDIKVDADFSGPFAEVGVEF
jgi:outer membrane protein